MTKTAGAKILYALRINANLLAAARRMQAKTGTPVTWMIETALTEWLQRKRELKKPAKRTTANKRK